MKNITKKLIVLSFVLSLFAFGNNVSASYAPTINLTQATNITSSSAKLNGIVNPNGASTDAWFELQNGNNVGNQNLGSGNSAITMIPYTWTGLSPNTTYQFRVVASNSNATIHGNWVSFTTTGNTPPPPPPQLPSVDLYANNTNLSYGGSTTLNWDAYNATSCNGSGGSNGWSGYKNPSGGSFYTGALYNTTTYSITCTNSAGSDSDSVTIYVTQAPPPPTPNPTVNLTANPMSIAYNGTSMLSWSSTNATSCNATGGSNGWSGPKNTSGTFYTGNLTSDKTYNITCTGNGGSAVDSVTVNVGSEPYNPPPTPNPTVNLTANPMSIAYNGTSMLSWSSTNATSCNATGGSNGWSGPKNTSGTFYTGNLTNTTSYNITCTNSSGSASDSVSIYVSGQPYNPPSTPTPTVNLWANPSDIGHNGSTTLYWTTTSATSCTGSEGSNLWAGAKGTSGSFFTGNLSQNTTYILTCYNSSGSGTDSVTVSVENDNNNDDDEDKPEVTTKNATNIDERSATLNGEVENWNFKVNEDEGEVWFEYSDDRDDLEDDDGEDTGREDMDDEDDFSDRISGLRKDTTYYFRAVARNDSGTDYGSIRSFRTEDGGGTNNNTCTSNNCAPQAVTTLATNIGSSSARLNGLGIINGNAVSTGYFEWGTSSFLGASTPSNTIGISGSNPYSFSLFGLSPSTTYFYRAVVVNQYGTSRGDISTFRTNTGGSVAGSSTTVVRNTTTVVSNEYSGTARPSLVFLDVDRDDEVIRIGEVLDYTIDYRNISKENLYNVILQIHLPKELRFVDTSRGYFSEENNTVVVNIGDLNVGESGSVVVTAEVTADAELGKVVVVAANLAYTIVRNENQEEVFAYSKNTIDTGTVLGASAIFGNGFWPNSLLGWLLLLLLILLIILAARAGYNNTRPQKVVNNHYEDHRNPPTYTGTQTHL
ncbi:MAG: DUF11 domain-containing protein [Candidatus Pacebacteria bacterium]|nr:DUF11 domain-containing protein [Candidatus Paceibacterota bacterium]